LRRYGRLAALGIGAYLLILLVNYPANRAAGYLEQQLTGLSLQAVSGTVYSGRAANVVIQGLQAGAAEWTLRPAALLLGRLDYHVTLDGRSLQGSGNIGSGPLAGLVVKDVTVEVNPQYLVDHFSPVPIKTLGAVMLTIDTLRIRDGFPDELYGHMSWKNAALQEPVSLSLGQVDVVLGSTGDSVTGNISNTPADTAVSGDISLLAAGRYNLRLLLKPRTSAPVEFVQMLDAYGQRQSDGSYVLTESGQW
jgi:general secretion pathway protein N